MAQSSWPDPAASRVINDVQYERLVAPQYVDGLVGSTSDTDIVYADGTGRVIFIRANKYAQLRGHAWTSGGSALTLNIGANASGSTRTDLVVLGLDRSTWAVTVYVKAGTPGAGAPALQLDAGDTGIYEMPLAEVTVTTGATVITAVQVKVRAWWTRPDGAASAGVDTRPTSPWPGMRLWEAGASYVWNGTFWERTSNLPIPVQTAQGEDMTGAPSIPPGLVGNSTWNDISSVRWPPLVFTVPQSGRVCITVSGWIENRVDSSSTIWLSYRAAGGGMVSAVTDDVLGRRAISAHNSRMVGSKRVFITGLTPGATVTLTPVYYSGPVSTDPNVSSIREGTLLVEPAA